MLEHRSTQKNSLYTQMRKYMDVSSAINTTKTYFNVIMGDCNAKLGKQGDGEKSTTLPKLPQS